MDDNGLNNRQVCEAAFISQSGFSKAMRGKRDFTLMELTRIAYALGVTPDQLLPDQWPEAAR